MGRTTKTVEQSMLAIMQLCEVGLLVTANSDGMPPLAVLFKKIFDEASNRDD